MTSSKPVLVFSAAVMDMLHEGHLNLLAAMRKRGDMTAMVLHDGFSTFRNKRKFPVENLEKRTRNLIECGLVDIIRYTFDEEPIKEFTALIQRFRPRFDLVFMRGDDWLTFPGRGVIDYHQIPIEFVSYTRGVSSTELRREL